MNWFTAVVVYVLVWWITLFAVLPLWVQPSDPGDIGDPGAPKRPLLLRKAIVTTIVAAVIWLGIYLIVVSPWFSLRQP